MRGLAKMIENEDYCMDIITSVARHPEVAASRSTSCSLENHLRTHVTHMFEQGGD